MKRNNANIGKEPFGQDNSRDVVDAFRPRNNMDVTRMSYDADSVMTDRERADSLSYADVHKADKQSMINDRRASIGDKPIAPQDNKPLAEIESTGNSLDAFIAEMDKAHKAHDAELDKIEADNPNSEVNQRRQRRNALIASIGDGLSSIAKMYFATKGAPSSQGSAMLTESAQKQVVDDANRYYALLSKWREENRSLLDSQANMRYKAESLKKRQQQLDIAMTTEARLALKDANLQEYKMLRQKYLDRGLSIKEAHYKAMEDLKRQEIERNKVRDANQNEANQKRADAAVTRADAYKAKVANDIKNPKPNQPKNQIKAEKNKGRGQR